jgi:hypothetical protein
MLVNENDESEFVEICADLFDFKSLLRVILLGCNCGDVNVNVHIGHDVQWWRISVSVGSAIYRAVT